MYKAAKENFGNPSSLHALGFEAGNLLYDARRQIEDLLPPAGNVIFTSGGTESDNMALLSSARKLRRRGNRIITTKVEHPAILETCKRLKEDGFEVIYLDVDVDGYVEEQAVKAALDFVKDENTGFKNIVASTASPYKFAADVLVSLGQKVPEDMKEVLDTLSEITKTEVPAPLATLFGKSVRFTKSVEKTHESLLNEVLSF
jgi:hypothetical protein